jgi:hypothetical protein
VVRDVAVLFAIGIGPDEFRRVLGVSGDLLDAEVHWGAFFESLVLGGCVCGNVASSIWRRMPFTIRPARKSRNALVLNCSRSDNRNKKSAIFAGRELL